MAIDANQLEQINPGQDTFFSAAEQSAEGAFFNATEAGLSNEGFHRVIRPSHQFEHFNFKYREGLRSSTAMRLLGIEGDLMAVIALEDAGESIAYSLITLSQTNPDFELYHKVVDSNQSRPHGPVIGLLVDLDFDTYQIRGAVPICDHQNLAIGAHQEANHFRSNHVYYEALYYPENGQPITADIYMTREGHLSIRNRQSGGRELQLLLGKKTNPKNIAA